jgi:hypothetical protein
VIKQPLSKALSVLAKDVLVSAFQLLLSEAFRGDGALN